MIFGTGNGTARTLAGDVNKEEGGGRTAAQMDEAFWTETVGFSRDIWDFTDLDVANHKYPQLKK
jgi:hypothetical protein